MAWYTRPSSSERAANRARTLGDLKAGAAVAAGIALPIRKAGKLYRAAKPHATKLQIAAGAVAAKGVVGSAVRSQPWYFVPRDVLFTTYVTRYHPELLSRGGSTRPKSSQQVRRTGGPSAQGASGFGRSPSARKRTIRRAKAYPARVRSAPWCFMHKRRHWCRYTRK